MSQSKVYRIGSSHFADSDEEAKDRYLAHKSIDPFPEIPSALLNSADISDYVAATGLIFPFDEEGDDAHSASHRVRLLGEVIYWESSGEKGSFVLSESDEFRMAPNSITFITLEPFFRIPDYIKVWFHLDPSHVYKGLYLNSSFIDPGFVGRLSLPLHNPTANEYVLRAQDPLIWLTFMKISHIPHWNLPTYFTPSRQGKFREFQDYQRRRQTGSGYLRPVRQAVGDEGTKRHSFVGIAHSGKGSLSTETESILEDANRREGWSLR